MTREELLSISGIGEKKELIATVFPSNANNQAVTYQSANTSVAKVTTEGVVIQFEVKDISVIGRNTSGVRLMNLDKNSDVTISSIAKVRSNPETSNPGEIVELTEATEGDNISTEVVVEEAETPTQE